MRSLVVVIVLAMLFGGAAALRVSPSRMLLLSESDPPELPDPVEGVLPSHIVDTFGAQRSGGRHHLGIDILAKRGSTVLSTTKGFVVSVGDSRLGGHTVWALGPGAWGPETLLCAS
jgi:peptidoglycan LD-endopeptidase LytH